MSLDFRVNNIDNYYELYPKVPIETWKASGEPTGMEKWNPRTEQIVWGCMAVGIGVLKESTVEEWYARYTIWCQINGFEQDLKLLPFKDVVQHIGLTTNVFPQESRTQWLRRIVGDKLDRNKSEARYNRSHNNDTYNGVKKVKVVK